MKKWEYAIVQTTRKENEFRFEPLEEWGESGYELVQMVVVADRRHFIFKKEKQS
jgi:hypothetical protein